MSEKPHPFKTPQIVGHFPILFTISLQPCILVKFLSKGESKSLAKATALGTFMKDFPRGDQIIISTPAY